jgi:hypothetical protein
MLAGPKRAVFGPNEPPRSDRAIADSWRGLYGSAPFSSMLRVAAFGVLRNGAIGANISVFAVFFTGEGVTRGGSRRRGPEPADWVAQTLSNCNLTGSGANRILKTEARSAKRGTCFA